MDHPWAKAAATGKGGPPGGTAMTRTHRTLQNPVSSLLTRRGKGPSTRRTKWAATRPPGQTQLRSRPSLLPTWSQGRPRGCPARPLPTPGTHVPWPGLRQLSGAVCSSVREEGGTLPLMRRGAPPHSSPPVWCSKLCGCSVPDGGGGVAGAEPQPQRSSSTLARGHPQVPRTTPVRTRGRCRQGCARRGPPGGQLQTKRPERMASGGRLRW